ncbi:MAG: hypothetical protein ACFBWO_18285 [Paracoccaceae bacterium]
MVDHYEAPSVMALPRRIGLRDSVFQWLYEEVSCFHDADILRLDFGPDGRSVSMIVSEALYASDVEEVTEEDEFVQDLEFIFEYRSYNINLSRGTMDDLVSASIKRFDIDTKEGAVAIFTGWADLSFRFEPEASYVLVRRRETP